MYPETSRLLIALLCLNLSPGAMSWDILHAWHKLPPGERPRIGSLVGIDPNRPRLIDMREPICDQEEGRMTRQRNATPTTGSEPRQSTSCALSMDVARPVLRTIDPSSGLGASEGASCQIILMPWSPFPCFYDPARYNGTSDQPSDLCSEELTALGLFRRKLTDDCFTQLQSAEGGDVVPRVRLSLRFKVAEGHQYDRTYTVYINDAVVSFAHSHA